MTQLFGAFKTASVEEMRAAVMFGRLIGREGGVSVYSYRDQYLIISDHELGEKSADEQLGICQRPEGS